MSEGLKQLVKEAYKRKIRDAKFLHELKSKFSSHYVKSFPTNSELIQVYRDLVKEGELPDDEKFLKFLRKRGVRSLSGIASITVITKAYPCPGRCIFCPTEPEMPKSYLSNEPAIMRAILNDFDPYKQTLNRLKSLDKTGHKTDKIDLIVSGGTFSFYPHRYQTEFTRGIFNALNYPQKKSRSLAEAQKINETAEHRCIGLSFETRPDHIDEKELIRLRNLGCTKIEIGVQSLNDRVLKMNKRDHGIAETKHAIQLMRDAAYKINCHMMPNLYGSTPEIDYADMVEMFANPAYRPDWMKIYPTMVVPWSQLEKIHKEGKHRPYSDPELIELMVKISGVIPEYCRVTRMYRDIPAPTILGGSKMSNLRQFVDVEMKKRGLECRCIRCREIKDEQVNFNDLTLNIKPMEAAEGQEFFVTYDDLKKDKICALLRLRFSSYSLKGKKHFIKELEGAALVREVHTYGEQVEISRRENNASQHIGLGRRMMLQAEEISKKNGYKKLAVISGIGVREYYKKLGYELEGTYMVKYL
ncbi:MAG: tRNA uridine(34) 5-carboxymethylaminomethyl modification radical SAM/GNAT enzyme Elp3 [Candidatus Gracilibacteria bacterium]|jgi:elongator complex protein 3